MKKAVYGGTFDPPHNGHVWIVREAATLFDEVVVVLAENPDKHHMFPVEIRERMLREVANELPNVRIALLDSRYLVEFAAKENVGYLVRGMRSAADFEYERTIRDVNADIDPSARTVFFMPPAQLTKVSSTLVKGLIGPSGWERAVARYVPSATLIRLIGRQHHWLWEAFTQVDARDRGDEDAFWCEVLTPYFEKHRTYHTWAHISAGLYELARIQRQLENPAATGLAWVGHDIVYDVWRDDNEERSALFVETLAKRLNLPNAIGRSASRMVRGTKKHIGIHHDDCFLNDIDLAILGYPERDFDKYEEGVAAEYALRYTPQEFAVGRMGWIANFRNTHPDRIYATDLFERRYGMQAQKNLRRSIGKDRG
ncbi:MAG: pantetheine-phosphate adenylyltransferase [bacterium]|nr:pantetheine-phosphate adenylyltransferase [bacterium]